MNNTLEDEFGDIIQKARTGQNFTLSQLSQNTGIPQAHLSKMENYTLKPTEEQVKTIASALNLSFPKLLDIAMENWTPEEWDESFDSKIEVVPLSMPVGRDYSAYSYLLISRETDDSAVVDTGVNADKIVNTLDQRELNPKLILVTHGHSDHTGGLRQLQDITKARVYVSKMENLSPEIKEYSELNDGDVVKFDNLNIKMLHTPGHTGGSCCYHVSNALFSGDTLFAGSLGRGNYSYTSLLESVSKKLFSLYDNVHVFPGHGPVTTIGQEKEHNPFF